MGNSLVPKPDDAPARQINAGMRRFGRDGFAATSPRALAAEAWADTLADLGLTSRRDLLALGPYGLPRLRRTLD